MNFIKRIGIIIYAGLLAASGLAFIFVSLGVWGPEKWLEALNMLNENISCKAAIGATGAILVIIGIAAPYRLERKLKKNRLVAFQNPDGEVTVSLSAIEDYIRKVAKNIPGIKDISSRVNINRKGINILASVSMLSTANIPAVTEKMQMEVKNKIQVMLGVEERVNVKMHVKRISGMPQGEELPAGEAASGERIPYREME